MQLIELLSQLVEHPVRPFGAVHIKRKLALRSINDLLKLLALGIAHVQGSSEFVQEFWRRRAFGSNLKSGDIALLVAQQLSQFRLANPAFQPLLMKVVSEWAHDFQSGNNWL